MAKRDALVLRANGNVEVKKGWQFDHQEAYKLCGADTLDFVRVAPENPLVRVLEDQHGVQLRTRSPNYTLMLLVDDMGLYKQREANALGTALYASMSPIPIVGDCILVEVD